MKLAAFLLSALGASACDFTRPNYHHRHLQDELNTTSTCVEDPDSAVQGLRAELKMISRQTRGVLHIISNCRLEVSHLEVAFGSDESMDLDWYAAESLEESHVTDRTLLAEGGTYTTLDGSTTQVHTNLEQDLAEVGAILLVERATDDILGHALIQKLVPGPAADLLVSQPTYLENCLSLSSTLKLRWTVTSDNLEVGLEYIVPQNDAANTWMAFGPASPGVQDRLMGGSDVVIAGFREEEEEAFSEDYYIGGYEVCTETSGDGNNKTHDGVCRDGIWAGSEDDEEDNTKLLHSQIMEGVAFLRIRRPLKAANPEWDHDITPNTSQHFVWAKGPLDPSMGMAEVQFHGYQFGQLKDLTLGGTPTWECPPLQGIELEGDFTSIGIPVEGDEFAARFDHRTVLVGNVVEVFWTLLPETNQIHLGARAIQGSSQWMSIAVGDSMTDAWAWVATISEEDNQLLAYRMTGLDAGTVRLLEDQEAMIVPGTPEVATDEEFGHLTFQVVAQWPLPGMTEGATAAPLIWAVGPSWRSDAESPQRQDEHSQRSKAPTTLDFATGDAEVGDEPQNSMLLAHGALMWIAWLVVAPFTGIASRFVKGDPCIPAGPLWIQLHKAGAATVLLLSVVGLILAVVAVNDAGLRHIVSAHAKVGLSLLCMIVIQNFFGLLRPSPGTDLKRVAWEWSHRILAVTMLAMAVAAVITGSTRLEDFDSQARYGVTLSVVWVVLVAVLMIFYEVRKRGILASVKADTDAAQDQLNEPEGEAEERNAEEPNADVEEPAAVVEEAKPTPSAWIGTWQLVYGGPALLGIAVLVVLCAVTFSGSTNLENEMTAAAAVSESSAVATNEPTVTADPTDVPFTYVEDGVSTIDVPDIDADIGAGENITSDALPEVFSVNVAELEDCLAWPPSHVGDGWCDDHEAFNTEACGWDGGDCCDINGPLYNCKDPESPNFGKTSPRGWNVPTIPRNPRYTVSREESLESWVISYNNYYEFGLSKNIVDEANKHADFLAPESWFIDISGLVENPMTLDVKSLIGQMQLEERLYRHRCVEAWSITAPWIGFPLAKVLDMVKPKAEAEIVQFVSWKNHTASRVQATSDYPWPYTEALTIDEAKNEMTMLTVGAFGKPLTPQQGAPIRLTVPWKYGFKSIKSIEKMTFLADDGSESRKTFWSEENGLEYGFYANINPEFPHRRWSQASERHYVTGFPGTRLPTTRMNGYQEQVDYMYADLNDGDIYY